MMVFAQLALFFMRAGPSWLVNRQTFPPAQPGIAFHMYMMQGGQCTCPPHQVWSVIYLFLVFPPKVSTCLVHFP